MGPPYGKLPILFPSGGPIITLVDSFLVPQVLVAAPRFLTQQGPGVHNTPETPQFLEKTISHAIHVWNIYLHFVDLSGRCR